MPGSWNPKELPNLIEDVYEKTSEPTRRYNCIAWAAGDTQRKWWPDPLGIGAWFDSTTREATVDAFVQGFGTQGYVECADGSLEDNFEKVAIFAQRESDGTLSPTHAATQLPNGHWSSKLGDFEDVEHFTVDAVNGPAYGAPVSYLKRPKDTGSD